MLLRNRGEIRVAPRPTMFAKSTSESKKKTRAMLWEQKSKYTTSRTPRDDIPKGTVFLASLIAITRTRQETR